MLEFWFINSIIRNSSGKKIVALKDRVYLMVYLMVSLLASGWQEAGVSNDITIHPS